MSLALTTSRSHAWATAGLIALFSPGAARAEGVPHLVYLELPQCPREPFSFEALRDGAKLELLQAGVVQIEEGTPVALPPGAAVVSLRVPCDPESPEAILTVRGPLGTRSRVVDLTDLSVSLRARGIALALGEYLPIVWPALEATAPPESTASFPIPNEPTDQPRSADMPPDVTTQAPSAEVHPVHPRPPIPWEAEGSGGPRLFVLGGTTLWGGRLRGWYGHFGAGGELLAGHHQPAAGWVESLIAAGELSGRFWVDVTPIQLEAGPRLAVGTAIARTASDKASEFYLDAAIEGRLSLRWRCAPEATAAVGYARGLLVTAADERVVSLGGPFLEAGLGVRCRLE